MLTVITATATAHKNESHTDNSINTVLVASSTNYHDALISSSVAGKVGTPILLTEKDRLSESTTSALEELDVKEAIIVGGPSVINNSVESEIGSQVENTTRIWGTTQIGTSIELSSYFWTESSKATVVQQRKDSDKSYKQLSAVKDKYNEEDGPILLSKNGTVSASVLEELDRLNVSEVDFYAEDAINASQDIRALDIDIIQQESRGQTNRSNSSTLKVIASPSFGYGLGHNLDSNIVHIRNSSDLSIALDAARETSIEKVLVVGELEKARSAAQDLDSQLEKDVRVVSGSPEAVSSNLTIYEKSSWKQKQNKKLEKWRQEAKESKGMETAANQSIERANSIVTEKSDNNVLEALEMAEKAYGEKNYFSARKLATKAYSLERSQRFESKNRSEIEEEIREERMDLREATEALERTRKDSGIGKSLSISDRIDLIRNFRFDKEKKLEKETYDQEKRAQELKNKLEEMKEEKNSSGKPVQNLRVETDENTIMAETKYLGSSAGFSEKVSVERNNSDIWFRFEFNSPEDPAAQVLTHYNRSESIEVEDGSYNVSAALIVDNKTLRSIDRSIDVTSEGREIGNQTSINR